MHHSGADLRRENADVCLPGCLKLNQVNHRCERATFPNCRRPRPVYAGGFAGLSASPPKL